MSYTWLDRVVCQSERSPPSQPKFRLRVKAGNSLTRVRCGERVTARWCVGARRDRADPPGARVVVNYRLCKITVPPVGAPRSRVPEHSTFMFTSTVIARLKLSEALIEVNSIYHNVGGKSFRFPSIYKSPVCASCLTPAHCIRFRA